MSFKSVLYSRVKILITNINFIFIFAVKCVPLVLARFVIVYLCTKYNFIILIINIKFATKSLHAILKKTHLNNFNRNKTIKTVN